MLILPYMEQLAGKTQAELVQDLQGVIFKVPNCEPVSYVAADEYLSGNVRNKLTIAELAAKNDPELAVNVEALKNGHSQRPIGGRNLCPSGCDLDTAGRYTAVCDGAFNSVKLCRRQIKGTIHPDKRRLVHRE